jgi:hypothetical protein
MKKYLVISLAALSICAGSLKASEYITGKSDDGSVIFLSDGTTWKVDSYDTYDSRYWSTYDDVVVEDDRLINLDEKEVVEAVEIR